MSDQASHLHGPVVTEGTAAHDHGGQGQHGASDFHDHRAGGIGKYIAVFVALCFLTGCSFFTYIAITGPGMTIRKWVGHS